MPILPLTHQSWLFAPPLDMPLALRLENGRFDSLRPRRLPSAPPCATNHLIPADDPSNPTGADVHFATGLHQAVDLASAAGNCVYAAYSGRVARVDRNPAATKGNVTIDHHPRGLGFVTNDNHITDIRVEQGEFVHEGEPFAQVSAVPETPHLHFELWAVVDRDEGAPGDSDMAPIDPTRALYAWEQRLVPDEPLPGEQVPIAVGVTRTASVPFFRARFEAELTLHVPMYEPVTEDERATIALLREAHRRAAPLEVSFRHSAFWGLDVVTQAELT
jgi:peptidase M23-like protein